MPRLFQMIFLVPFAAPVESFAEPAINGHWLIEDLNRSLDHFAARWDILNQRLLAGNPMLDSRFVDGMLRHFGDGSEKLCLWHKDNELAGMLIVKPGKPGIWTSFLPPQAQVGPSMLAEASGLSGLLPCIPGLVGQMDLLCQDPDISPAFKCEGLPHRRHRHALTMSVSLTGDFDSYWAGRPKSLRGNMRTRENRLAKSQLAPRLIRLDKPGEMAGAVKRFGALESSGWKGRAGTAVGRDCQQSRFYTELMEKFAETGQGHIYEYWMGGQLAASQLAITSNRMMVLLKTAYEEGLAYYAPGRQLLRKVIRDGFARCPGGVIEFYTNADSDQLAWATDQRWIEHISLYRNPTVERMINAIQATRRLARNLMPRRDSRALGPS